MPLVLERPLTRALTQAAAAVEEVLEKYLPVPQTPERRVVEAMRHGLLGGGKRFRAFLVLGSAELFAVPRTRALNAAAAVEMVHAYSLIHDDLPAMDDDDMRRGKPTVHKAFDEATAILAGDALLTLAFQVLAEESTSPDPGVRTALMLSLSKAAGAQGMVGGQMLDLMASETTLSMPEVTRLQQMKTGRLIAWPCEAGAILGHAGERDWLALTAYAHDLGLVFQIADDLLDVRGDAARLGKAAGKDAEAGKATFIDHLGEEGAERQARLLVDQAKAHLDPFGPSADLLRDAASFVLDREH